MSDFYYKESDYIFQYFMGKFVILTNISKSLCYNVFTEGTVMSIYLRIKNNFESFSKSEKKVARYCLDNFLEIGNYTIAELSDSVHCGEATIFRFCKKIDFDSFYDFKVEVQNEVNESARINEASFVNDIYSNIQDSIEFTIQNLNQNELDEIGKLIYKSKKIFCVGVGNSGIPSESCAMRFLRNGFNAIHLKDTHFQSIYLAQLTKHDCAILFSHSGESRDTIHIAEILKNRNVPIISITSSVVSTLANLSDYHILTKSKGSHIGAGSMIQQINQMYVADLLVTRVGLMDSKKITHAKGMTYDYIFDKMNYSWNKD